MMKLLLMEFLRECGLEMGGSGLNLEDWDRLVVSLEFTLKRFLVCRIIAFQIGLELIVTK